MVESNDEILKEIDRWIGKVPGGMIFDRLEKKGIFAKMTKRYDDASPEEQEKMKEPWNEIEEGFGDELFGGYEDAKMALVMYDDEKI